VPAFISNLLLFRIETGFQCYGRGGWICWIFGHVRIQSTVILVDGHAYSFHDPGLDLPAG